MNNLLASYIDNLKSNNLSKNTIEAYERDIT